MKLIFHSKTKNINNELKLTRVLVMVSVFMLMFGKALAQYPAPKPIAYAVTGGGSYCHNGVGLPVGLADSESDVIYTLYKNSVAQVPTVQGTGAAITFGNQLFGTYTVRGTNRSGTIKMNGSAVINETPNLPASVKIAAVPSGAICAGTSVTFTATPTNGGTPTYQWKKGVANIPGETGATYKSTTLANVDKITVVMTSTATCATGSPATSNELNITVNPCYKTLNLTSVMLEGLYNGGGTMRQACDKSGAHWSAGVADHITVELHSTTSYATIVYTAASVPLSTSGSAMVNVPGAFNGSYFITIKHRNSLETTTATAVSFAGSTINQSFGARANVFGNNLCESPDGHRLIYGGDVNQDGSVDTRDYIGVDNDSFNYIEGYIATDADGNGVIDTRDFIFIDNNNYNYINTIHP